MSDSPNEDHPTGLPAENTAGIDPPQQQQQITELLARAATAEQQTQDLQLQVEQQRQQLVAHAAHAERQAQDQLIRDAEVQRVTNQLRDQIKTGNALRHTRSTAAGESLFGPQSLDQSLGQTTPGVGMGGSTTSTTPLDDILLSPIGPSNETAPVVGSQVRFAEPESSPPGTPLIPNESNPLRRLPLPAPPEADPPPNPPGVDVDDEDEQFHRRRGDRYQALRTQVIEEVRQELYVRIHAEVTATLVAQYEEKYERFKREHARDHPGNSLEEYETQMARIENITNPTEKAFRKGCLWQWRKEEQAKSDRHTGTSEYVLHGATPTPRRESTLLSGVTEAVEQRKLTMGAATSTTVFTPKKMAYKTLGLLDLVMPEFELLLTHGFMHAVGPGNVPPLLFEYFSLEAKQKLVIQFNYIYSQSSKHKEFGLTPRESEMTVELAGFLTGRGFEDFLRIANMPNGTKEYELFCMRSNRTLEAKHGIVVDAYGRIPYTDIKKFIACSMKKVQMHKHISDWWPQYTNLMVSGRAVMSSICPGNKPNRATGTIGTSGLIMDGPGWGPTKSLDVHDSPMRPSDQLTLRQIFEAQMAASSGGESKAQQDNMLFLLGRFYYTLQSWNDAQNVNGDRNGTFAMTVYKSKVDAPFGSRSPRASSEERGGYDSQSTYVERGRDQVRSRSRQPRGSQQIRDAEANSLRALVTMDRRARSNRRAHELDPGSVNEYDSEDSDNEDEDLRSSYDYQQEHRREPIYEYPRDAWGNLGSGQRQYDERDHRRDDEDDYDRLRNQILGNVAVRPGGDGGRSRPNNFGDGRSQGRPPDHQRFSQDQRERSREREQPRYDSRYPANPAGDIVDTRARSAAQQDRQSYLASQPCYAEMSGTCTRGTTCPYSHDGKLIKAAFSKMQQHQDPSRSASPKVALTTPAPRPAQPGGPLLPLHAVGPSFRQLQQLALMQQLTLQQLALEPPQQVHQLAQEPAAVAWESDYDARKRALDEHYVSQLAQLQRRPEHNLNRELASIQRKTSELQYATRNQGKLVLGHSDGGLGEYREDSSGCSSDADP